MRIIIIGAVAAGTSAAAKARRNDENAEIVIYEKDSYISYSGCGMPYFIGGEITDQNILTPRSPAFFKDKYNVDIFTMHEVTEVNPDEKTVRVKSLNTGDIFEDRYDKLVFATGASAVVPPIKGVKKDHVFTLRSIGDMERISGFLKKEKPKNAVIIGTGFIGLEMCESLVKLGISVTLIEQLPQVAPLLDSDMAVYVKEHLESKGVSVLTGTVAEEITEDGVIIASGGIIAADIVLTAAGIKPETALAAGIGIELSASGAIMTDKKMRTNIPSIYACGDCIQHFNLINNSPIYVPLGSTANKTGRIAGDAITGGDLEFRGILGTGIFRLFDLTVARTGFSEQEAVSQGHNVAVCHNTKPSKPSYMGGSDMVIKAIADKKDGRLLGVQIVGGDGVDKRIDVFVTAITFGAKAEDLFHLDLAYAPPFSTTKDPVMYTGMILDNAINRSKPLITSERLQEIISSGTDYNLIDARQTSQYQKGHIDTAISIPHEGLREAAEQFNKDIISITYCNKGTTGNAAQSILLGRGFREVYNLSGGYKHFNQGEKVDTNE